MAQFASPKEEKHFKGLIYIKKLADGINSQVIHMENAGECTHSLVFSQESKDSFIELKKQLVKFRKILEKESTTKSELIKEAKKIHLTYQEWLFNVEILKNQDTKENR